MASHLHDSSAARTADERRIMEMFSYMRPAGSKTEQAFVDRFLTPLGFKRDKHRNLILTVGGTPPTILWSSHMDTVHDMEGRQTLHYDGETLALSRKAKKWTSSCLGADCTAGVWLMAEMVKAGVPGLYVIHHAEEKGCIGSRALAKDPGGLLDGIQAAIAFDRMGYNSIITHQMYGKTASDAFALSLGAALGGEFKPDDTGSYTDTNEYAEIIPECTNVSVGYFHQHTMRETQDVPFLLLLRDTLITADFTNLVIEREPGDEGYDWGGYKGYSGRSWSHYRNEGGSTRLSAYDGLEGYVRAYPEVAAQLLEHLGIDEGAFKDTLDDLYGSSPSSAGDPWDADFDHDDEEDDDDDSGFGGSSSGSMGEPFARAAAA